MKKRTLLLTLTLALGLASCSSSTGPADSLSMSCTVGGTSWTATTISKSGTAPSAYIVGMAEKGGVTESMSLMLDSVVAGRVIHLTTDSLSFSDPNASLSRSDGTWRTKPGSGSVTITEVNGEHGKGTFEFMLYKKIGAGDSTKVTNGMFSW